MSNQEHLRELVSNLLKLGEGLLVLAGGCQEKVDKLQKLNEQLKQDLGVI